MGSEWSVYDNCGSHWGVEGFGSRDSLDVLAGCGVEQVEAWVESALGCEEGGELKSE